MLSQGFRTVLRPKAPWGVAFGESQETDSVELEVRFNLALALLDSLGLQAHFAAEPGDAWGKSPDEGYDEVGAWGDEPSRGVVRRRPAQTCGEVCAGPMSWHAENPRRRLVPSLCST
jgi:hypothetical protein